MFGAPRAARRCTGESRAVRRCRRVDRNHRNRVVGRRGASRVRDRVGHRGAACRRQIGTEVVEDRTGGCAMWKVVKRWWKYLAMKLHVRHEENADPKVQLEQAIQEAKERHQQLTEQAANVIANQKQAQVRLDRAVDAYEKANASARQALLLA